jgi:alanine transaminase
MPGRDGYPATFENIYLSNGASSGVNTLLHTICAKPETGIMVPIPQYPLYTATLSVLDARVVPYYLEEKAAWGTSIDAIRTAYDKAVAEGTDVKAICVINPGNPTGASLPAEDIKAVLKFAAEKGVVVVADEVYQTNVFIGEFISFKKALRDLQKESPGKYDDIELASLHSVSKGMVGECGHRGGYFELIGFDPEVAAEVYKFISIQLCPPVLGQCIVEMMVNPPKEGEPSYALYREEYDTIFKGLKERAYALYEAFKRMEGVECDEPQVRIVPFHPIPFQYLFWGNLLMLIQGSMYLFPTINLPPKAIEQAKKEGREPDEFYCFRMLDATGVCVVAGSGFGQKEGTLHFRTTFLAPGTEWTNRLVKFHEDFMAEFK